MNLGEASAALGERGFDYLGDRCTLMLNTAKDAFEDAYEWPWLTAVASAQPTPLTLADLKLVQLVKDSATRQELWGLDVRQVAASDTDLAASGAPSHWWLGLDAITQATVLHAWPGDNGASVDVIYIRDSPPLVAPTDTPLIPARYHGLWIDYAVCEAYKDSDNFSAAAALRADIGARLQDIVMRYEVRNRQHSTLITVHRPFSEDE